MTAPGTAGEARFIDDGGPAFARPYSRDPDSYNYPESYPSQEGLTLRDYFAAKALNGLIAGAAHHYEGGRWVNLAIVDHDGAANKAYILADAMIQARKGGS